MTGKSTYWIFNTVYLSVRPANAIKVKEKAINELKKGIDN